MSDEVARFHNTHFFLDDKEVIVSPILQLPERLRKNRVKIEALATGYISEYQLVGKKVALFVGRFVPEKALSLFINRIADILSERDDYRFVLVGEGREKEQISAIVKAHQLEEKVILPGKFQADELYGWYACASGFILPSLFEPFGAVVNEALIFGLPVLCSQYAGASTLIQQGNGYLFNPSDDSDIVHKFSSFMENIQVVERVDLSNTPPLIEDHRSYFNKEWRKVSYG